jgi:hypothetical protein
MEMQSKAQEPVFHVEPQPIQPGALWQEQRLGKFTASEIYKLMQSGKKKDEYFSCGALSYIYETIAEILTGEGNNIDNLWAIKWGNQYEPEAIAFYKSLYGNDVVYYGKENPKFFDYNDFAGGSPDGIIDDSIVAEVKCPQNSGVHVANLRASKLPDAQAWLKKKRIEYYTQIQFNMLCTGLNEGLFISYDPRVIDHTKRLALIKVIRDEELLSELIERIGEAVKLVKETLDIIKK